MDGSDGDVIMNSSLYTSAGLVGVAKTSSHPWVILKAGDNGGTGGFSVFSSTGAELMRVSSNGPMRLMTSSYFSGRTEYHESSTIANNIVHDVRIVNPRDSAGTGVTPIVFFNARSDDEVGSPATTKYQAFTYGYYPNVDVNFDSQIRIHWPQNENYHFRAWSQPENKATFWVKAATDLDGLTQTRADMYVSGNVGIGGAPSTTARLAVVGNTSMTGNLAITGAASVSGDLAVTGNITGAKVFNAVYQDVAEWVPSTTDIAPGTVVTLNPNGHNEVMPTARAYDTAVAGVVSAQPGVLLGMPGDDKEMVATTGRVRVKVDATAAPVRVGDLLVSSDRPGMAMRSIPVKLGEIEIHRPGTIIGKALEPLAAGEAEILVLLSLQ